MSVSMAFLSPTSSSSYLDIEKHLLPVPNLIYLRQEFQIEPKSRSLQCLNICSVSKVVRSFNAESHSLSLFNVSFCNLRMEIHSSKYNGSLEEIARNQACRFSIHWNWQH